MSGNTEPCIRRGFSRSGNPARAARELFDGIYHPAADLGVFFCSTEYDLQALGRELSGRFGDMPVIGCTSAGEITPVGYLGGSITGFSLLRPEFTAVVAPIHGLDRMSLATGAEIVQSLRRRLNDSAGAGTDDTTFAFLLIDGLCRSEEIVVSVLHAALGGIPLFGGSAGGDVRFGRSFVFHGGRFDTNCAVLVLVRTSRPVKVFTTDHFESTNIKMVVTEADPSRRVVSEINAEPAAREYARLVALDAERLTSMSFATHPVVVKVGGRYYVRSIQKMNDDGSLTFFCAIDKGIVLTLAKGTDILDNLEHLFEEIEREVGTPDLVIGCDCILRNLELEQKQLKARAGRLFARNNVIGFSTYGEQFQAMHVNQTFTGAAIGLGPRQR